MNERLAAIRGGDKRSLFIEGYFSERIWSGDKPTNYGYPKNHLPETNDRPMTVVTGFVVAQTENTESK